MRLAAIDIGSNAVRLLIADINKRNGNQVERLKKLKLYRVPVRLGVDAFSKGYISERWIEKFLQTMQAFQLIMQVYEVEDYRACATSAMREASNSEEILTRLEALCGMKVSIIAGGREANLILSNKIATSKLLDQRFPHLFVDVGGGSTEISLLEKDQIIASRSFKIGTIRLYHEQVKEDLWNTMQDWLQETIKPACPLSIIGSGGNINRVLKRSFHHYGTPLMYDYIRQERDLLAALTIEDRIHLQDLNEDRAEVIVPALDIFLFVMEHSEIRQVVVPKIGLADGIVRNLFYEKTQTLSQT